MKNKTYMRKIMTAMMAAALALAGCSQSEEPQGGEATVTLTLSAPDALTRAAVAPAVDMLQYAVYDLGSGGSRTLVEEGELNSDIEFPMGLDLQLITGRQYGILLWAGYDGAPYALDLTAGTMTPDYTGATANSEALDAFYAYQTLTVNGNASLGVTLKRPFAMVNIGTSSEPAEGTTSSITVEGDEGVAQSLNLITGELSEFIESATFAAAAVPTGMDYPVSGYYTLAYAYVLAPAERAGYYDVSCTYGTDELTAKAVSLQANYRTNIYK